MENLSVPFILSLPDVHDGDTLKCERTVRTLPGKRLVCAGTWHGQSVYIKLFFGTRKARRNWEREKHGIQRLGSAGILTPALLYSGFLPENNSYILVLAAVEPALTLKQLWDNADTQKKQRSLLNSMAIIFASHHNAGIVHNDPHLKNFLMFNGNIYTLDGADVENRGHRLTARTALKNLAVFFSILHIAPGDTSSAFFDTYIFHRQSGVEPQDYPSFVRILRRTEWKNTRKYLNGKIFRECTDFSRERTFSKLTILSRAYDSSRIRSLLAAPASSMGHDHARIIKSGNTSTVALTESDGKGLVIKHYKIKGVQHGLRKAFACTRAEKSWKNSHRMIMIGILTAAPVAIVINTIGPLRRDSFFITEHVKGQLLADYLENNSSSPDNLELMAGKLAKLIRKLAVNRITHGDMKASNILVRDNEPFLMDLDSMKQHRSDILFRLQFRKDMERFMRNWPNGSDFNAALEKHLARIKNEFA